MFDKKLILRNIQKNQVHFCTDTNKFGNNPCNAQWMLLYTYAAHLPEDIPKSQQNAVYNFYYNFPDRCVNQLKSSYKDEVTKLPPFVETRREVLVWLNLIENRCRFKSNLPSLPNSTYDLVRRWSEVDDKESY